MQFVKQLQEMERNKIISGQLFFRGQGPAVELDLSSREIFTVAGIVAIPKGSPIKDDHQYAIAGFEHKTEGGLIVGIDPSTEIDLTEQARGDTIAGLLLQPIWKI